MSFNIRLQLEMKTSCVDLDILAKNHWVTSIWCCTSHAGCCSWVYAEPNSGLGKKMQYNWPEEQNQSAASNVRNHVLPGIFCSICVG